MDTAALDALLRREQTTREAVLLLLYNGQRGHKSKWFQWGYYLIYPIHFIVLYIIELLAR